MIYRFIALLLFIVAPAAAQESASFTVNGRPASFVIEPETVSYNMLGYSRTLPRDVVVLARESSTYYRDVWDLNMMFTIYERQNGALDVPKGDLLAAIDSLGGLGAHYQTVARSATANLAEANEALDLLQDEFDLLKAENTNLSQEIGALRAAAQEALRRAQEALDRLSQ